jgi:diadenosine tetraphosphate (Ap4A) HIT family hydrolase
MLKLEYCRVTILFFFSKINLDHAEFLHQVPDEILADMLPLAKKVAIANGLNESQYNILQVSLILF